MSDDSLTEFKFCQIKVNDARRQFLRASMGYHEISLSTNEKIDENAGVELLTNAVICAVISPEGKQKRILLKKLFNDERS